MSHDSEAEVSKLKRFVGNLAVLAGLACLSALFYIIMLLLTGKLSPLSYIGPQNTQALRHSLALASTIFGVALWVFMLLLILRWPTAEVLGWIILAGGILFYNGAPILILRLAPDIDLVGLNSPGKSLLFMLQTHGAILLCAGSLRILVGLILRRTVVMPGGGSDLPVGKDDLHTASRQCWELPACRRSLRNLCPRFIQHVSCWRVKSGCYCDKEVTRALLSAPQNVRTAADGTTDQRALQRARQSAVFLAQKAGAQTEKTGCVDCSVYQEHQRYKFRLVTWVIYPVGILLTWIAAEVLRRTWHDFDNFASKLLGKLSILPAPILPGEVGTADLSWAIVVVAAVIVISIAMKIAEYLVFKRGL